MRMRLFHLIRVSSATREYLLVRLSAGGVHERVGAGSVGRHDRVGIRSCLGWCQISQVGHLTSRSTPVIEFRANTGDIEVAAVGRLA